MHTQVHLNTQVQETLYECTVKNLEADLTQENVISVAIPQFALGLYYTHHKLLMTSLFKECSTCNNYLLPLNSLQALTQVW